MDMVCQYATSGDMDEKTPYRVRLEANDGQAIEIVEQMDGGFLVLGAVGLTSKISLHPLGSNSIVIKVSK